MSLLGYIAYDMVRGYARSHARLIRQGSRDYQRATRRTPSTYVGPDRVTEWSQGCPHPMPGPAITRPRTEDERRIVNARVEAVYQGHLKQKTARQHAAAHPPSNWILLWYLVPLAMVAGLVWLVWP